MLPLTDEKIIQMLVAESSVPGAKCPPHNFAAAWANKADALDDETVSVIFCTMCGVVHPLRLEE